MSEEQRDKLDSPANRPDGDSPAASDAERAEREHTFTRRALVQAGWVIPAAVVLNLPDIALAASNGAPGHTDSSTHTDTTSHADTIHTDTAAVAHTDVTPHTDVGHIDLSTPLHIDLTTFGGLHVDTNFPPTHDDTSHDDQTGSHADLAGTPHSDAAHTDTPSAHSDSATHGDT